MLKGCGAHEDSWLYQYRKLSVRFHNVNRKSLLYGDLTYRDYTNFTGMLWPEYKQRDAVTIHTS